MPVSQSFTVRLQPRRALPFFSRHPWVFAGAIAAVEGHPQVGDEVRLISADGQFIARGLYNPHSQIRVRLYSWQDEPIGVELWSSRLARAASLREQLFPADDPARRACRLVFSEGDGLSGLTVDRYGDWLLTQWTSAALWEQRELLLDLLWQQWQPQGIWLRTEKGMSELEQLVAADGLVRGAAPPPELHISEHGVTYRVDVVTGQKTGFYYDQRENRLAAARYAAGARVLDVCSYSGGFGLTALVRGGAESVLAIDSSRPALELAARNAELNGVAQRYQTLPGDAAARMAELVARQEQFDLVVLDPPKLARTRGGIKRAAKGYTRLNALAVQLVRPGGILVTCSCSGLVSLSEFQQAVVQGALQSQRELQWIEQRFQAVDHPVSAHCLETEYLKCLIARVH